MKVSFFGSVGLALFLIGITLGNSGSQQDNSSLVDDAGGRKPEDFPEIAEDVFQPMDGGIELSPEQIKGRNTWNLWCAGTDQFWERMSRESYGLIDLLKTINSRGHLTRFKELGQSSRRIAQPATPVNDRRRARTRLPGSGEKY